MYVVVVPSILGYLAYKTDVSARLQGQPLLERRGGQSRAANALRQGLIDFQAKRKGDTVYER